MLDDVERDYLRRLCRGSGYVVDHDGDQWRIDCRHGHVYCDGQWLVASFDAASRSQRLAALKLGEVVADGDHGELSVKFWPTQLRAFARLLLPRQQRLAA